MKHSSRTETLPTRAPRLIPLLLACFAGLATGADEPLDVVSQDLLPRQPWPTAAPQLPDWSELAPEVAARLEARLVVKFVDELRVRADADGHLMPLGRAELDVVRSLATRRGLGFEPLLRLTPARLATLELRAATASGRAQPDLAGLFVVRLDGTSLDEQFEVARELAGLAAIERAWFQTLGCPPPGDIAPPTPDLVANQGYLGVDPGQASVGLGLDGSGVRLADCEFGWNTDHEDLVDRTIVAESGQTPHPSGATEANIDHGTAVIGIVGAPWNGYGIDGIAPGADLATYPEWSLEDGYRRTSAITAAIADSGPGDVVLLEMQTVGPGKSYGPAELDPAVHLLTRVGSDAGVIVVAAAGNGNQDLDHWLYASYMAMGDSGALVVGAGESDTGHDKLYFSSFGSRVNVQGWGAAVFTLGYGYHATYGGDPNQEYMGFFSGTSSAAALVAGAVCLVQERALAAYGEPLSPGALRELLIATGIPQASGDPIGPALDVAAATATIVSPWSDLGLGMTSGGTPPALTGVGSMAPDSANRLELVGAPTSATGLWVVGFARLDQPLFGGTLVPLPQLLVPLGLDLGGSASLAFTWPGGLPVGSKLFAQAWMLEAPAAYHASNGLRGAP